MPFTMEDFNRQYVRERFSRLTPDEQAEVLQKLPVEDRLAGLTAEQIQEYLDRLSAKKSAPPRKPRRKK
ncbi:MAG TPA: hypothetical protein VHR66_26625 [Gemmataceae bacterium]|nr:hypothetical protein [Gemmataceae bacterium]